MAMTHHDLLERYVRGTTGGYNIPKPGQLGPRPKPMPVPGMPTGKFAISKGVTRRLRKDILTLIGNVPKVKTVEQHKKLYDAVQRWHSMFEGLVNQTRLELKTRKHRSKGRASADANAYMDRLAPLYDFLWELRTMPPGSSHEYMAKFHPGDLKNFIHQWPEDGRKWAQRAKKKARETWKLLDEIGEWARSWRGDEDPIIVNSALRETVDIEGFRIVVSGFDDSRRFHKEGMASLKAGLKRYRARAKKVMPWLISHQLPMVAHFEETDEGDTAANYVNDHINLFVWAIHADPKKLTAVLAHEMGHHIFNTVLSSRSQDMWRALIYGFNESLDLAKIAARRKPGEPDYKFSRRIREEDPVLAMRLEALAYSLGDNAPWEAGDIDGWIEKGGDSVVTVTRKPITAYANKNPAESFCEVLGLIVGYGPRAVDKEIQVAFKLIVPNIKMEDSVATLHDELFEAAAGDYEVLSPNELDRKFNPPRRADEIDQEWVDGIRKGWKQIAGEAKNYEGRGRNYGSNPTQENVHEAWEAGLRYLQRVDQYVNDLRSMLLITKGMWHSRNIAPETWKKEKRGAKKKRAKPALERPYAKTVDEINAAVDFIDLEIARFKGNVSTYGQTGTYTFWKRNSWVKADEAQREKWLKAMPSEPEEYVDKAVKKLDSIISNKLLRHLSMLIKKMGTPEGKLYTGNYDAPVVHVGKFTVIFGDVHDDPRMHAADRNKPSQFDTSTDVGQWDRKTGFRAPYDREPLARGLQNTIKVLQKKGFGFLAYGKVQTMLGAMGVVKHPNPKKGGSKMQAAATYHRGGDYIQTYVGGKSYMPVVFIHELGHRYWFKFLSSGDRRNFKGWFGKAKPTNEYGESNPAEDFAELFTSYVLYPAKPPGYRKLTKDNYERMKAFLGRKKKLEATLTTFYDELFEATAAGKSLFRVPTPAEMAGEPSEYTPSAPDEKFVARAQKRLEKKPRKKKAKAAASSAGSSVTITRGQMVPKRLKDHEIDEVWIKGIRKWWKSQIAPIKELKGWTPPSFSGSDDETGQPALDAEEKLLGDLRSVEVALDTLSRDLLIKKAFWNVKSKRMSPEQKREKRMLKKYATRAVDPKIRLQSSMALNLIEFGKIGGKVGTIIHDAAKELEDTRDTIGDIADELQAEAEMLHPDLYEKELKRMSARLVKGVTSVEKAVSGRLLRYLSTLIKKHGDPGTGKYSYRGTSFAPEVVHVGRFNVIFDDLPTDPTQPQFFAAVPHPDPERKGAAYGAVGVDTSALKTPQFRTRVIGEVKKAIAMLRRDGLSFLVYGDLHKRHSDAYNSYTGSMGGRVLATYNRINDMLDLYSDGIEAEHIVHELGHRYYYKYMNAEDRRNFSRFFKQVPATTSYGGTSSVEDFAEVFRSYVARKKMTKAQRHRFEQFLNRKNRSESIEDELRNLLAWVRYDGGDGMVEAQED